MTDLISKWQTLLQTLQVYDRHTMANCTREALWDWAELTDTDLPMVPFEEMEPWAEPEILSTIAVQNLEQQLEVKLPDDYKAFLQVFGTGLLGKGWLTFSLPDRTESQDFLHWFKQAAQSEPLKTPTGEASQAETQSAIALFNSALVFGAVSCQEILFWDLRSPQTADQSYDIYLAQLDYLPISLGRDFYGFVHDICLGLQPEKIPLPWRDRQDKIALIYSR
jgi:hypothetical protein